MKTAKFLAVLIASLMWSAVVSESHLENQTEPDGVSKIVKAQLRFALDFFKPLIRFRPGRNIVFSPVSITSVLQMVYLGSKGRARQELVRGLKLTEFESDEELQTEARQLLADLETLVDNFTLHLPFRLFCNIEAKLNSSFVETAEEFFGSRIKQLDFWIDTEGSRECINKWLADETGGNIDILFGFDRIPRITRLLVISAGYFRVVWKKAFDKTLTKLETFHVSSSKTVNVQMMTGRQEIQMMHSAELGCTMMRMNFTGDRMSMSIVLPDDVDGLEAVVSKVTAESMINSQATWRNVPVTKVNVRLPRFVLTEAISLRGPLQHMRVSEIFFFADLSGIGRRVGPVTFAVHKARIKVDEEGVAAAETDEVTEDGAELEPAELNVNKAFVFAVHDNKFNSRIFVGRVSEPFEEDGNRWY